ncbi:MAG TPA: hypothetical protein PLQ67_09770 [Burkholderiaceae bacterium]|nr:hypothetical protein [Burkholderiaceae bacterium]
MTSLSIRQRCLTLLLLLSVAVGHVYGAWHGVAHFDRQGSHPQALTDVWAQLADADHSGDAGLNHSCVVLDALCSVPAPLGHARVVVPASRAVAAIESIQKSFFLHQAWAHPSARAPPVIAIA